MSKLHTFEQPYFEGSCHNCIYNKNNQCSMNNNRPCESIEVCSDCNCSMFANQFEKVSYLLATFLCFLSIVAIFCIFALVGIESDSMFFTVSALFGIMIICFIYICVVGIARG